MDEIRERGVVLINPVVGEQPNHYFNTLEKQMQRWNVQIHPMVFSDLLNPETQKRLLLGRYPKIIIGGNAGNGPHFVDVPSVHEAYGWIPRYDGDLLGICRGSQILGLTYGAELKKKAFPEKGIVRVTIHTPDPIVEGLGLSVSMWAAHSDGLVNLPENFKKIASSDICPVQIFRGPGNHYGSQNHMEVLDSSNSKQLLLNFLEL